jgi:hypothetical protein
MPPVPLEYHGRDDVARFYDRVITQGRIYHFEPTRANGQPAFGTYLRDADGILHAMGLIVLTLRSDGICATARFENSVLPWFGLPRTLPG